MFKDERYAREKRVRNCFKYWSWIVKLNAFWTQWRKNMKKKVVVDIIYVLFDMGRVKRIW